MTFPMWARLGALSLTLACGGDRSAVPPVPPPPSAAPVVPDGYSGPQIPGPSCCCMVGEGDTFDCSVTASPSCGETLKDHKPYRDPNVPARCVSFDELTTTAGRLKRGELKEPAWTVWEACLTTCGVLGQAEVEE